MKTTGSDNGISLLPLAGGLPNNSSNYFNNFSYFLAGRDLRRVINPLAFLTLSWLFTDWLCHRRQSPTTQLATCRLTEMIAVTKKRIIFHQRLASYLRGVRP